MDATSQGLRRERMHASKRFAGGRFHNPPEPIYVREAQPRSMASTSWEYLFGPSAQRRPPAELPVVRPSDLWRAAPSSGLRATWLGHSSVLLEIDGHRVLTDPVWSGRISPVPGIGPRRFQAAPAELDQLPPLDAVVLSHDHYDHLDAPTVRRLAVLQPDVVWVTSLGVGARLEALGVAPGKVVELDWWEEARVRGLGFTATPSRHFSGRSPFDRNRTLWSSFVVESDRHAVFFSGDTGLTSDFEAIREHKGPFDLVMLEVGAFHPAWGDIHLGPENALVAHRLLGGGPLLPVHWGTFDLALHAWDEPIETLVKRAGSARLLTPRLGEPIEPSHDVRVEPWWRSVRRAQPHGLLLAKAP